MRKFLDEGKLILIAIPVLIWTLLPIYHLFVLSISNQESMLAGKLADTLGYGALFCLATAISAVAVIATVRMIARSSVGKPA